MGLFDGGGGGGFDLEALLGMLGPGAANAAGGPMPMPGFDDATRTAGADALRNAAPQNLGQDLVNPNPVPEGTVPLPKPFPGVQDLGGGPPTVPGQPPVQMGLPGPTMNPAIPTAAVPPGGVGAALSGEPIPGAQGPTSVGGAPLAAPGGTSGATDISAQAKGEAKRPSLAEALKGVKAPPEAQLQKIATPNAPRPTTQIRGGDLQALLMALNAGAPNMTRQLPVTLGAKG